MRHEKDYNYRTKSDSSLLSDSAAFDDSISYCLQKGQKLSAAIHLVTDHLSLNEPLRTSLRGQSIELLTFIADHLRGERRSGRPLVASITALVSCLAVAEGARAISPGNVAILRSEYESLRALLHRVTGGEEKLLSAEALAVAMTFGPRLLESKRSPVPGRKKDTTPASLSSKSSQGQLRERSHERRKAIFALLTKIPRVTVRDIAGIVPGVSEKTLQRELVAMVGDGALKREGKRRWSTYSLMSNSQATV